MPDINISEKDIFFMQEAIKEAKTAALEDEVPVGAVIVFRDKIIAKNHNRRENDKLPFAHAELMAMEAAARVLGGWRLIDCTLYVTLEPCVMCAGAAVNARIPRIVFGAYDKRFGALGSIYSIHEGKLNHSPEVTGGILETECADILSEYFRKKRGEKQ